MVHYPVGARHASPCWWSPSLRVLYPSQGEACLAPTGNRLDCVECTYVPGANQALAAVCQSSPILEDTVRHTPMKALVVHLDGTPEAARRALGAVVCANVRSAEGKRLL